MRILLLGHTGTLGAELLKLNPDIFYSKERIEICNYIYLRDFVIRTSPDIIINCVAKIDNREIEKNPHEAIKTNIIGASNVALICQRYDIRLVYISTDYIYNGKGLGNHSESDDINPENLYAWTKLGGECATKCVKNHLIIRTSFGKDKFPHGVAFGNQFTSKDYVDVIAPMILKASLSELIGVLNVGTKRKSMYDYAISRNPSIPQFNDVKIDHSLNLDKYNSTFNTNTNENK